jgi:hypothetical protein
MHVRAGKDERGSLMSEDQIVELTKRIARSVQTTIGWIFWDPGAVERFEALGVPGPLGYIASRCAPLSGAGPQAVNAAFGSISPLGIALAFDIVRTPDRFAELWRARDEAVVEGVRTHAPAIEAPLVEIAADLWQVVEALPVVGRVLFGAVLGMDRPEDPLLSGWHAINAVREWRGDTHWALVVAAGLTHPEASILHNAWLGYEDDWLARSRGTSEEDLAAGWAALRDRGLVVDGRVTPEGIALRQWIEDETDRLTTLPWELLGAQRTEALAEALEPPCELLLARVDVTAGPNYQPASRHRPKAG